MEARSVLRNAPVREEELLGDARVCIAVLDGPVDLSHPCFAHADLTRLDTLVTEPAGQGRMSLHGTHVTSLLFGRPGSAVFGLAPRCRGLILPVFRDARKARVSQLDLARAIERAVQEGAHIINISGGERTPDAQADAILERALRLCDDEGVLVVAAVGNDGCDCLQVPAAVPSVLAVGALGTDGSPLEINNWGAAYRTNGVLAPGQDIEGAAPGGGRAVLTGSSFATPVVSGTAALLVAAQLSAGGRADPRAAAEAILKTASTAPCSPSDAPECRRRLVGTLDAARAYDLITGRSDASMSPSGHSTTTEGAHAMEDDRTAAGAYETAETAEGTESPGAVQATEATEMSRQPADPISDAAGDGGGAPAPDAGPAGGSPVTQAPRAETSHTEPMEGANAMEANSVDVAADEATGTVEGRQAAAMTPAPPAAPAQVGSGNGDGVRPSCGGDTRCSCGGGSGSRPLVYAIGTIGFDFRTEARRDTFRQLMPPVDTGKKDAQGRPILDQPRVYDPQQISDYLSQRPWESDKLTWTLELDRTPIYALEAESSVGMEWGGTIPPPPHPHEKHAEKVPDLAEHYYPPVSVIYKRFREAIVGQTKPPEDPGLITRVSIPGVLTDRTVRLFSGQVVPVVEVWGREVATWAETALVEQVVEAVLQHAAKQEPSRPQPDRNYLTTTVRALLDKFYYEFRNLGQTSADRALNYAGTNAFASASVLADGLLSAEHVPGSKHNFYSLDTVRVSKSPYCRIGSDCQDVIVTFMDPEDDRRANVNYLFTVDPSDNPPVNLAPAHRFLGNL